MRHPYISLLILAPIVAECAVIELVCSSPKSEFLEKQESYITEEAANCKAGKPSACALVESLKASTSQCAESEEQAGQQYTFKFSVPPDGQLGESPAESMFKACGKAIKPSGAQTTVTGTPDLLRVHLRYPGLSSPMVFRIDRETLQAGFKGKLNFTCIKSQPARNKQI